MTISTRLFKSLQNNLKTEKHQRSSSILSSIDCFRQTKSFVWFCENVASADVELLGWVRDGEETRASDWPRVIT